MPEILLHRGRIAQGKSPSGIQKNRFALSIGNRGQYRKKNDDELFHKSIELLYPMGFLPMSLPRWPTENRGREIPKVR